MTITLTSLRLSGTKGIRYQTNRCEEIDNRYGLFADRKRFCEEDEQISKPFCRCDSLNTTSLIAKNGHVNCACNLVHLPELIASFLWSAVDKVSLIKMFATLEVTRTPKIQLHCNFTIRCSQSTCGIASGHCRSSREQLIVDLAGPSGTVACNSHILDGIRHEAELLR